MRPLIQNSDFTLFFSPIGLLGSNATFFVHNQSRDTLIVDAGNAPKEVEKIIERENLIPKVIIHTHAHFDHIGGSGTLVKKYHLPIFLHEADHDLYFGMKEQSLLFKIAVGEIVPVDRSYTENLPICVPDSLLDKKVRPIFTPGHTKGGVSFLIDSFSPHVLIAGDTLFRGSIGRTDLPGGNFEELISSIKNKLFKLPDDTIVVTGHGPETTIGNEKSFNPFLNS